MGQKISPIGLWLGITHKCASKWFVDPRNGSMQKNYPSLILEDWFIRDFITPKFPWASVAHILIFRTLDYIRVEIHTAPTQNLSLFSNNKTPSSRIKIQEEGEKSKNSLPQSNLKKNNELISEITQGPKMSWKNNTELETLNDTYDSSLSGLDLKILQEDLQLALAKYKRKTLALLFSNPLNTNTEQNLLENSWIQSVNLGILIKQLNKPFQYASIFAKYLATQLEKRENTVKQAFNRSLRLIQNYKIWGIKIKVSGRLNGADIAEHKTFFKGRIPLSSLDAKIDYSYETAKTLYGILGVKVWIWREEN